MKFDEEEGQLIIDAISKLCTVLEDYRDPLDCQNCYKFPSECKLLEVLVDLFEKAKKKTAKEIYKDVLYLQELMVNSDDALCILRNVENWAKEEGVEVEE